MTVRIINADVMEGLRQLPDESVHCCVTSPPYWGLRDYGVEGQIGLEATPELFVSRMVEVFSEVRRVLRKDGTCWVNLGDSYCSSPTASMGDKTALWKGGGTKNQAQGLTRIDKSTVAGLKPKDLVGIPWRVAFALQADGWYLRSDIIWHKPNPMPESVTDRPTKSHEYIFLLTKSERYAYDHDAIREPQVDPERGKGEKSDAYGGGRVPGREDEKFVTGWRKKEEIYNPAGRNKRTVWTIATAPYAEAHFATFPPELPEICIKAGCPVGGTVLDPFSGAGTTAMVADRLQRNAIGIELNPEYAAMSQRRIDGDRGGLLDLMEAAE
jgi:DNA modification methylase